MIAVRPLMAYLEQVKDPENRWTIEMVIAQYCMRKNRIQEALVHAEASLSQAPAVAQAEISETLGYLRELALND